MSFKIEGLDELQAKLNKLEQDASALDGSSIPLDQVFTDNFISSCSDFESFVSFMEAGGFSYSTQEEFASISEEELDLHVKDLTSYESWEEMKNTAAAQYAKEKLGL